MASLTTPVKHSNGSSQSAVDDLDSLQANHLERIRVRAEKGLRSLIHKEYLRRLGQAMSSLKGMSFNNPAARMREARRRLGIGPDEVYGGELSAEAVFAINTSGDAERYLKATDDGRAGGTIFGGLEILRISASDIARVIAEATTNMKKSVRLVRAEEAAERENASAAHDSGQGDDVLKQILAKRSSRRTRGSLSKS